VPTEKLAEAVLRHLARDIVEGRLKPGEHLVEVRLSEELGVSRSPLREAIHRLAAEGLITLVPRKGAFVADLSAKDLRDVFAVRAQLERLTARLAAERAAPEAIDELRGLNEECAGAVATGDVTAFFEHNDAFHSGIARAADNAYLRELQRVAAQRTFRPLFLYLSNTEHLDGSIRDHDELIQAIATRDGKRAENVMLAHLDAAEQEALRLLDALPR
jgi:DNA-binding GntR family transcriptional regulator